MQRSQLSWVSAACLLTLQACSPNGSTDPTADPAVFAGTDGHLKDFGLSCSLTSEQTAEGTSVVMQIANEGNEKLSFVSFATAWDNATQVFEVEGNGGKARYMGIRANRPAATDSDLISVAAGREVQSKYLLSKNHRVFEAGTHSVHLKSTTMTVRLGGSDMLLEHGCGSLDVDMQPGWGTSSGSGVRSTRQPLTYHSSCSNGQRADVERIKPVVRGMLDSYADHVRSDSSIYREWFGSWSSSRGDSVEDVLDELDDDWDNWDIRCNTGSCVGNNWNAYVTGSEPGRVYLCNGWFGLDSIEYEDFSNQAGVMVHELTHLLGSTDDKSDSVCTDNGDTQCYGEIDARALASDDAGKAVDSAENYEHFVSNLYVVRIMASMPNM